MSKQMVASICAVRSGTLGGLWPSGGQPPQKTPPPQGGRSAARGGIPWCHEGLLFIEGPWDREGSWAGEGKTVLVPRMSAEAGRRSESASEPLGSLYHTILPREDARKGPTWDPAWDQVGYRAASLGWERGCSCPHVAFCRVPGTCRMVSQPPLQSQLWGCAGVVRRPAPRPAPRVPCTASQPFPGRLVSDHRSSSWAEVASDPGTEASTLERESTFRAQRSCPTLGFHVLVTQQSHPQRAGLRWCL